MHRLIRLIDKKTGKGKMFQAVLLLALQKFLTPTPAMGFILGSVVAIVISPFVLLRIENLFVAALTVGVIVCGSAGIFQRVHDIYWEKHE